MKTKQLEILHRILAETKRPCGLRAFLIGILFPEFERILGHLSDLSKTIE